jgi:hypothetical protein
MRTYTQMAKGGKIDRRNDPKFVSLLASANAPILPASVPSSNIDWRMPLQGWPTTVHQSVVICDSRHFFSG